MTYRQSGHLSITNSLPNREQSPHGASYVIHRKPPANQLQSYPGAHSSSGSVSGSPYLTIAANSNTQPLNSDFQGVEGTPGQLNLSAVPASTTNPSLKLPAHQGTPAQRVSSIPHPLSTTTSAPTSNHASAIPTSIPGHHDTHKNTTTTSTSKLNPLTPSQLDTAMSTCLSILQDAINLHSKRPFSALLLSPDNTTVLATHNSISHFQHAESELTRLVSLQYSFDFLERCTLVSTWEPCAMCAGTIYWGGIGRVAYAASEKRLKELTGGGNGENLTMDLPCRIVFGAGQRGVDVIGPIVGWEERVVDVCKIWWDGHRGGGNDGGDEGGKENGESGDGGLVGEFGDDGEYQADLKVDWMS